MANVEIRHHTVNIKDIRMHYTVAGSGETPVLLLHSWPHTAFGWREVQSLLPPGYTVIAPDLRSQGYSSKPEAGYDADNLADDFYELMRHLGYTKAFRRRCEQGESFVVANDAVEEYSRSYGNLRVTFIGLSGLIRRLRR